MGAEKHYPVVLAVQCFYIRASIATTSLGQGCRAGVVGASSWGRTVATVTVGSRNSNACSGRYQDTCGYLSLGNKL